LSALDEATTTAFPGLLLPRDRVAWEAWVTGHLAGLDVVAPVATSQTGTV
jgi:hypothetical protein